MEFDFKVVMNKGSKHQRDDYFSHIINGEALMGVNDNILDATLLQIKIIPRLE